LNVVRIYSAMARASRSERVDVSNRIMREIGLRMTLMMSSAVEMWLLFNTDRCNDRPGSLTLPPSGWQAAQYCLKRASPDGGGCPGAAEGKAVGGAVGVAVSCRLQPLRTAKLHRSSKEINLKVRGMIPSRSIQ